ncbi:MAG: N-methyl-L-tryptophan oxidase, partial [Vicinamibacteria bacterium]
LGADVLGLEQFEIGHVRGGSHDHSRIIRLSYHTPQYVRLAQQAYGAWAELEKDAGESLIIKTGGLDFAKPTSSIPLKDYYDSLEACGISYEKLDAPEIMRRWPMFRLSDDIVGLYQSESGIAPAMRCNAAHIRMARQHGATIRDQAPVESLRSVGGEVEVLAGGESYRCKRLIIAAGAWANHALAHFDLKLPLTVTQEQVTYFAAPDLRPFQVGCFPLWIWMDEPCYYGFPVYGENAVKATQDVGGSEVTVETRTFEADPAIERRVADFLTQYIPRAVGPVLYSKPCLYTMAPDRNFILDALPGHENVFIAVDSAHGFKFASLIGRILSELALDGRSGSDIAGFGYGRPILHMENPPRSFMV